MSDPGERTRMRRLTRAQARRIALVAQGFGNRDRDGERPVSGRELLAVVRRLGAVQIDSVNVLVRSHYLPFFSRLGPYAVSSLDALRDQAPRRLVEYWAHEASLITPEVWPLLGFRMKRAHEEAWGGMRRVAAEHPEFVAEVKAEIARRGPITARDLERAMEGAPRPQRASWWDWSMTKRAVSTSSGRARSPRPGGPRPSSGAMRRSKTPSGEPRSHPCSRPR